LCRLCPPPSPAHIHPGPYGIGHCPTLYLNPHTLQSGDSDQTVQGSHSPPPADVVPGQSALAPGYDPPLRHPRPRVEHGLDPASILRRVRLSRLLLPCVLDTLPSISGTWS